MFDVIAEVVEEVTGVTELSLDTDFVRDLGFNSFDIAGMINVFEEKYHVTIPVREVWHLHTVRDVIEYMKDKKFAF